MKTDHGLEATREIRKKISSENEHNPRKLCEYYQAYQKRFADRLRRVSSPSDDQQEPQSFDAGS